MPTSILKTSSIKTKNKSHLQLVSSKTKNIELARKRQKQIYRGALRVFKKKGFHSATIREIAEASNLSLGSLYDYIQKKEDILFLVHNEIMDEISNRLAECLEKYKDPVKNFGNIIKEIFNLSRQLHDEVQIVYTETKSLKNEYRKKILDRESKYVDSIESIIKMGVKRKVFRCEEPAIMANIVTYLGAIMPLRGWNMLPVHSSEEVHDEIAQMILERLLVKEIIS